MHMLHPASRHSNPASRKILSRPSASAFAFTAIEPGTTIASLRSFETCLPATTRAAARRSFRREFVHDPMNTSVDGNVYESSSSFQPHIFQRASDRLLVVGITKRSWVRHFARNARNHARICSPGNLRE